MPLKLNVGLSKKLGLPDYGSLGATCHVEVELDAALLHSDLETFHRQVNDAYVACSQAINDELARQRPDRNGNGHAGSGDHSPITDPTAQRVRTSPTNGNGLRHQATPKQLSYIRQLAGQIPGLDSQQLDELTQQMLSKQLSELSGFDASALIDQLKAIKSGQVDLQDVMLGESR